MKRELALLEKELDEISELEDNRNWQKLAEKIGILDTIELYSLIKNRLSFVDKIRAMEFLSQVYQPEAKSYCFEFGRRVYLN